MKLTIYSHSVGHILPELQRFKAKPRRDDIINARRAKVKAGRKQRHK